MNCILGILDYGLSGNIGSVEKAIKEAGGFSRRVNDVSTFNKIDKIVIPGVGNFKTFMNNIFKNNIIDILVDNIRKKPTLGICLGMHILGSVGFEDGKTKGLDLLDGEVLLMNNDGKVPHMGFDSIDVRKKSDILKNIESEEFYFMHSYELVNYTNILSLTNYNSHIFVSSVEKDNIFGVQFHPEKSKQAGIKLFKNFIEL